MASDQEKRIGLLLVDDEAEFRTPLAKRLDRRGFDVRQAESGLQAIEALKSQQADVVLMDVNMPGMNGLQVLDEIKHRWPKTEVIMLTGQACVQDGVTGIKSGAFDYLTKPIEMEHLIGKLKQAVEMRKLLNDQEMEAEFRREMERRMSVAERLAALGTMASGVAHEINNPLAIINEATGFLKGRLDRSEDVPEGFRQSAELALGKIASSVERASRITHQLLDFARKNDWEIQEFDLVELAKEVVDLTSKTAKEENAEVEVLHRDRKLAIWSDPYQMRQVLINLVTNAIQAVGEKKGGNVWVDTEISGNDVVVTIKDTGPGIPRENLSRIFDPFFSTKPAGKGTGLGLSVTKGIVEKLGGTMTVDSRLGYGAVFRMVLPRKPLVSPVRPDLGPDL